MIWAGSSREVNPRDIAERRAVARGLHRHHAPEDRHPEGRVRPAPAGSGRRERIDRRGCAPSRMRRTSWIACGCVCTEWPESITSSDSTPSSCALRKRRRRRCPFEVRAAAHRDDRVRRHARRDRQLRERAQERIARGHVVEARRQALEALQEDLIAAVAREIHGQRGQRHRHLDEAGDPAREPEVRQLAAAVRRRDEDHAPDEGQRLEEERALEQRAGVGRELDLVEGPGRDVAPEGVAAVDDGEPGQQPSLAVRRRSPSARARDPCPRDRARAPTSRSVSTSTPAE